MDSRKTHWRKGMFLGEAILGFQDGIVSNLGIALGVAGGLANPKAVVIAGIAAVFAEGVSMLFSQYSSSKAVQEFRQSEIEKEKEEMRDIPKVEREEIRQIYRAKGFKGKLLEEIVDKICSNDKVWLKTMEREELTFLPPHESSALKEAAVVGFAAIVAGLIPIIPFFLLPISSAIPVAIAAALIALFAMGAFKAKKFGGSFWKRGVELMAIGLAAALIGYVIGYLLGGMPV
ncbi:MAG: VIT1/CCC1 transporter family protein [Candidatus Diapherotrites archaeon]